jgi:hypothetical protein
MKINQKEEIAGLLEFSLYARFYFSVQQQSSALQSHFICSMYKYSQKTVQKVCFGVQKSDIQISQGSECYCQIFSRTLVARLLVDVEYLPVDQRGSAT